MDNASTMPGHGQGAQVLPFPVDLGRLRAELTAVSEARRVMRLALQKIEADEYRLMAAISALGRRHHGA